MFTNTRAFLRGASSIIIHSGVAACLIGCASPPETPIPRALNILSGPRILSGIDARFRWNRFLGKAASGEESVSVKFYQEVLSKTLSSHCNYFPSDSRYTQELFRRCGGLKAIPNAMARFYAEPDAAYLGFPSVRRKGGFSFENIPRDCSWF